ncbi:MAG: hypothetical protein AAB152_08900 [Candidatus Coatesbacteria bacterium]
MIGTIAAALAAFLLLAPAQAASLRVDGSKVLRTMDRHRLLGSNVAGWYEKKTYDDGILRGWIRDLGPILLRLPGGSWGNGTFWNGNGVRHGNKVDYSRLHPKPYSDWSAPWGTWDIDYSDYAPGFLVDVKPNEKPRMLSTEWHGNVDVRTMHDFIREVGDEPLVIVNVATGSPRDAAEWVRWANKKMGYGVRYWEIGNELGGSWECGHFLPDGSVLNGEIYAHRFEEFAKAMKAVDPTIKVGTMDWLEDVLKLCGDQLDFFSIHAYPAGIGTGPGSMPDDELFAKLDEVRRTMEEARATIRRVRPDREGKIEIDYSEWSMGWGDNRGALWHAGWVGEMFRHGAAFAMQWDVFGLVSQAKSGNVRRSIYWPFWLWSRAMGDSLVASTLEESDHAAAYATRSADGLRIMVINQSAGEELRVNVRLDGFTPASRAQEVRFTRREFFLLEENADHLVWNTGPVIRPFKAARSFKAVVPPASIVVWVLPGEGQPLPLEETKPPEPREPRMNLWFPPDTYAGDWVDAWAYVRNGEEEAPYALPLADGKIRVKGAARSDRGTVRLSEAAGHFRVKAGRPGAVTVEVRSGKATAAREVVFKSSVPRPRVFWEFEEEKIPGFVYSQWPLTFDDSIRPNERVARIALDGDTPQGDKKRDLLSIRELPGADRLDKKNIRGAVFDVSVSPGFGCDDPAAFIDVVMQSPANWWMHLGKVLLSDLKPGEWKTVAFVTDKPENLRAMGHALNLLFLVNSAKPIRGAILLDGAGLMVR